MTQTLAGGPAPHANSSLLRHPLALVFLLGLALYLPGLHGGYLWDRDETWYASCALNMVQTGDWLVPRLGSRDFFEKPPLAYWMMATAYKVFGFGEFASRLPSALMTVGTLAILYALAARQGGRRQGLMAAGMMGTMLLTGIVGRSALTDASLVLGISAGVACWWRMQTGENERTRYVVWCLLGGVAVGWGIMAKSFVGLLPGVIALAWMIARRDFSFLPRAGFSGLGVGIAAIVVVAAPWYVLLVAQEGQDFVREFFLEHNFGRMSDAMQGHTGPFWYYLPVLLVGAMPWTFVIAAVPWSGRQRDAFDLMLVLWAAIPLLVFSYVATKLPHYILPSLPPLALFAARELDWFIEHREATRGHRIIASGFALAALVGLVLAVAWGALSVQTEDVATWVGVLAGMSLAIGGGRAAWLAFAGAGKLARASMWAACGTIAFLMIVLFGLDALRPLQVPNKAAILAREMIDADEGDPAKAHYVSYGSFEPSMFLYSGGLFLKKSGTEIQELSPSLAEGGVFWILCRVGKLDDLRKVLPANATLAIVEVSGLVSDVAWIRDLFRVEKRFRLAIVRASLDTLAP